MAKPTAREKAYHLSLMDEHPCACGCGQMATVVHHILAPHPMKRGRRDHRFVVPMHWTCHNALHGRGNEVAWQPVDLAEIAAGYQNEAIEDGRL